MEERFRPDLDYIKMVMHRNFIGLLIFFGECLRIVKFCTVFNQWFVIYKPKVLCHSNQSRILGLIILIWLVIIISISLSMNDWLDWYKYVILGLLQCIGSFNSSPPGQNGRHIGRRHFQMHSLEWKWWNSNSNFTEACMQESNWQ